MRIGLSISFFALSILLFSQDLPVVTQDSLPKTIDLVETRNDSLDIGELLPEQKLDSLTILDKGKEEQKQLPKKPKKKRYIPYIKSMDEVAISDYKILYLDETEKSVDTSLSLEREFTFNFLQQDYFEYLPLPNMGEGFNKLGYDFHEQSFTPQMGARKAFWIF